LSNVGWCIVDDVDLRAHAIRACPVSCGTCNVSTAAGATTAGATVARTQTWSTSPFTSVSYPPPSSTTHTTEASTAAKADQGSGDLGDGDGDGDSGSDGCIDSQTCPELAALGWCEYDEPFHSKMLVLCPTSCGACAGGVHAKVGEDSGLGSGSGDGDSVGGATLGDPAKNERSSSARLDGATIRTIVLAVLLGVVTILCIVLCWRQWRIRGDEKLINGGSGGGGGYRQAFGRGIKVHRPSANFTLNPNLSPPSLHTAPMPPRKQSQQSQLSMGFSEATFSERTAIDNGVSDDGYSGSGTDSRGTGSRGGRSTTQRTRCSDRRPRPTAAQPRAWARPRPPTTTTRLLAPPPAPLLGRPSTQRFPNSWQRGWRARGRLDRTPILMTRRTSRRTHRSGHHWQRRCCRVPSLAISSTWPIPTTRTTRPTFWMAGTKPAAGAPAPTPRQQARTPPQTRRGAHQKRAKRWR
jgi:hypothetical protein